VHVFAIADNGTPAPALTIDTPSAASATTGRPATLTLGAAHGGALGGTLTARVQWGDASVTTDAAVAADGTVTGTHTWTAPGTYTVHVTVSDGQDSTTASFPVTVADPNQESIAASPSTAAPGASVRVTGVGFTAGERVAVTLSTPIHTATTVTADEHGRITAQLRVPARSAAGVYAVTAIGAKSQAPATVTLGVTDPAMVADSVPHVRSTLVLSSASAMPGERVSASGTGYRPNELVVLTATTGGGASVRLATVRADGDGVFATSFVVPQVRGGLRSVHTSNAAAPGTPPARQPLVTVRTPHGTRR
jgi:PKD repeat protein